MNATAQTNLPVRLPRRATVALMLLRAGIGWHFLYEGLAKLLTPGWSAAGFLLDSTGPFAPLFRAMAASPAILQTVNLLNIGGLLAIGICLLLGLFTRFAAFCGVALLALYYLANPPWFQPPGTALQEGHYLLVNKNLVELLALILIGMLPATRLGLDGLLPHLSRKFDPARLLTNSARNSNPVMLPPHPGSRRRFLFNLSGIPLAGCFGLASLRRHEWRSDEEKKLADAYSGATLKLGGGQRIEDLKGTLPLAKIGNVTLSRIILGGNLIGGWAHSRDLIYVSRLVKAYHHRGKIFQTFRLAEACGVNTILTNPVLCPVINDYWRTTGGKIQFISDCGGKDLVEMIRRSIDGGACACYIQGGTADGMVERKEFDKMAQALDLIHQSKLPAGIGGHKLATIQGCVEQGLKPDFWMKTLHTHNYWSAKPTPEHDNIWCTQPEETIAYMKDRPEPWIAFKTLAAGAILPKDGFRYAFQNGADFICAGMYDFQMIEDINIALEVLNGKLPRERAWRAPDLA